MKGTASAAAHHTQPFEHTQRRREHDWRDEQLRHQERTEDGEKRRVACGQQDIEDGAGKRPFDRRHGQLRQGQPRGGQRQLEASQRKGLCPIEPRRRRPRDGDERNPISGAKLLAGRPSAAGNRLSAEAEPAKRQQAQPERSPNSRGRSGNNSSSG